MDTNNWKKLYALAMEIKSLKPWGWMDENEIFGVHDPYSKITGYISVMGGAGEHFAITAYRGPNAMIDMNNLMEGPMPPPPEHFLEIPQLMLSFENREHLEQGDRDLIKALGLGFRGKNQWPLFRSYKPGFVPWVLDANEQKSMITYLREAIGVLKRVKKDRETLYLGNDALEEKFLVRAPIDDKGVSWKDNFEEIQMEAPPKLESAFGDKMFVEYGKRPSGILIYEMDFYMMPSPVKEKGSPPYYPYLLLLVEKSSEMVIGFELLTPLKGFVKMLEEMPVALLSMLAGQPAKPKEIHVQSERLNVLLSNIVDIWGIKLVLKPKLKVLNIVKKMMEQITP